MPDNTADGYLNEAYEYSTGFAIEILNKTSGTFAAAPDDRDGISAYEARLSILTDSAKNGNITELPSDSVVQLPAYAPEDILVVWFDLPAGQPKVWRVQNDFTWVFPPHIDATPITYESVGAWWYGAGKVSVASWAVLDYSVTINYYDTPVILETDFQLGISSITGA